ncbi:PTS system, trehalose-specific IIC component [Enterobacter sp. kpr-6]|uniref:PTS transporter subunit EIIC n=1 Tax=Enterobacter sp. kpr-6 TaxID=1761782 RepID=UPI0008DF5A4B|nr:PTS transporter subunit EIIC [Enterobacter sp. kpr-6]SFR03498.1 PTS system, trehalose-specific IIC component [Enterobacter sp. kpr-6]
MKGSLEENTRELLALIGGRENIISLGHCLTRLRLVLHDEQQINIKNLERNELVKGSFSANGQFQIIIGPGLVDKVYNELARQSGNNPTPAPTRPAAGKKTNIVQRLIKNLADIFIPVLPAIVASGLLLGLNNILANPGIFFKESLLAHYPAWQGVSGIITLIANTSFMFLPALIGWSAVKKFGGNPVLGIVLGLLLIHPDLMSAQQFSKNPDLVQYWSVFGFELKKVAYQGQVITVLLSAWLLARTERFLARIVPDMVQVIVVAPLTLLVTGFSAFLLIGPLTMLVGDGMTNGILRLFDVAPILAGGLFAFILSPLVITGMHHLFLGVNLQMIGTLGYTTLWPIQVMASLAQGMAALTIFFLVRNKKMQGVAVIAAVSAWLGVTEPAIFGVNLRYRFPFIAAMCGAGIAGSIVACYQVKATSIGISGLPGFLSIFTENWKVYFFAMGTSLLLTGLFTLLLSRTVWFRQQLLSSEES